MRLNRLTATLSLAGGALAQTRAPEDRESPAVVSKGYIIEYTQVCVLHFCFLAVADDHDRRP
jgi:hypothetical protein